MKKEFLMNYVESRNIVTLFTNFRHLIDGNEHFFCGGFTVTRSLIYFLSMYKVGHKQRSKAHFHRRR